MNTESFELKEMVYKLVKLAISQKEICCESDKNKMGRDGDCDGFKQIEFEGFNP